MSSQNRQFLTPSSPSLSSFLLSRVYLLNCLWGYPPPPYWDYIVYGRSPRECKEFIHVVSKMQSQTTAVVAQWSKTINIFQKLYRNLPDIGLWTHLLSFFYAQKLQIEWLFLTSMVMEAVRGQKRYCERALWHSNSMFGSSHRSTSQIQEQDRRSWFLILYTSQYQTK